MSKLRTYYSMTKPGIIRGNLMAAVAGFLLASQKHVDLKLMFFLLLGITLVIASGCVFNNYLDREIDKKMARTKERALVKGTISYKSALIFGLILALIGFGLLIVFTNLLTVVIGLIGFVDYVWLYGWTKRRTRHSTLVGCISGATPPVAGYVAASGHLDKAAILLFVMMVCWQMAHFLAISIYRYNDYKAAKLPVWPVSTSIPEAKKQILYYMIAFIVSAESFSWFGYTGLLYILVVGFVGLYWVSVYLKEPKPNYQAWGQQVFRFSLIAIMVVFVMLSLNALLP